MSDVKPPFGGKPFRGQHNERWIRRKNRFVKLGRDTTRKKIAIELTQILNEPDPILLREQLMRLLKHLKGKSQASFVMKTPEGFIASLHDPRYEELTRQLIQWTGQYNAMQILVSLAKNEPLPAYH
jgi:hypothetical protein